ncbi:hypothetical protein GGTG_14293 [Gaeumannomyces tritici R3-111a-1]|uniref:Uncharacterized protein n=1 Tax=Gaeumannomyces tritici (strain R3-111a-1) TaxID=644352 RepID=J3PL48_GAET3|nr:hypothetical protein GGTG_14293 [Gaeumannomyces tritici R3-111a-1]EJT68129.1 hypothetical protein GGTG_14293 [Gaeumannomyces tritici R3-111a-1]
MIREFPNHHVKKMKEAACINAHPKPSPGPTAKRFTRGSTGPPSKFKIDGPRRHIDSYGRCPIPTPTTAKFNRSVMDPPFKIENLLDMRESAGRVRFSARDMTPVEERGGLWRLPMSHLPLLQPVASLYNRDYFNTIVVAQAKARGLSITFDHGLECLWVENALVPSKGQMLVIIVLPKPLEPQAARVPVPRGMETLIHEEPRRSGANVLQRCLYGPASAD